MELLIYAILATAAMIYVAVFKRGTNLEIALREWQSGLGAMLGVIGIGWAAILQSDAAKQLEIQKIIIEGTTMAVPMFIEARDHLKELDDIDRITGDDKPFKLANATRDLQEKQDREYCSRIVPKLNAIKLSQLTLIEAGRSQMGKLPGDVAYAFAAFATEWQSVRKEVETLTVDECAWLHAPVGEGKVSISTNMPRKAFGWLTESMRNSGRFVATK